ncbi:MAG: hypothetical protein JO023_19950, partial [Chloroflexi bacterium]|nr:hypothetical protein [Chloroflexota bacterium]
MAFPLARQESIAAATTFLARLLAILVVGRLPLGRTYGVLIVLPLAWEYLARHGW